LTKARLWCVAEIIEARTGPADGRRQMALLTLTTSKTKTATTAVKTTAA
jgi:hypothetical protein